MRQCLLLAAVVSCTPIDGGAVELRWLVHAAGDGRDLSCAQAAIDTVRLDLDPLPEGREPEDFDFACETGRRGGAVTAFDVPAGAFGFAVVPRRAGRDLGPADGVSVPAPRRERVFEGEITDLGVLLIVAPRAGGES